MIRPTKVSIWIVYQHIRVRFLSLAEKGASQIQKPLDMDCLHSLVRTLLGLKRKMVGCQLPASSQLKQNEHINITRYLHKITWKGKKIYCLFILQVTILIHIWKIDVMDRVLCDVLPDLIMVFHAVWKTWSEELNRQKPRPKAAVYVVADAWGHFFYTAWETMIKFYYRTLIDWFSSSFYSHKYGF